MNVSFIKFNSLGKILGIGYTQRTVVDADPTLMEAAPDLDPELHYVDNGQIVAMPPKPGLYYRFSYESKVWQLDLDQCKKDKWAEIKVKRDQVEFGGFTWDGSVFDSDPLSQSRIQGAAQLATLSPTTFSIDWTLADNTVRTLSASQMVEVGETLGIHVATQHTIARGLRQQIDAATTAAEVEAITWP